MKEAKRNRVLPLDDRSLERGIAKLAGRPDLMARPHLAHARGRHGRDAGERLHQRQEQVEDDHGGGGDSARRRDGAILVQGGRFGGWALYMKDGKPAYDYNFLGLTHTTIASSKALPPGKATIKFDFAYDGGGMGKGGNGTLYVNGAKVAEGRIERTQAIIFSVDDTADVGIDLGTPVNESVGAEAKSKFTGKIPKVTIEVRDADAKADAAVKESLGEVARRTE